MSEKMHEIDIEIDNEKLLFMCLEAHKQDITLNEYMVNILKAKLKEEQEEHPELNFDS